MEHAAVPSMNREKKLSEWIEMYADAILKTCYLYLSDLQQAEDAMQDTWIKAWKHMDDLERDHIRSEKAWLLRIAINTCKDYRRTAWFRHIDRKRALEDLPDRFTMTEPVDRSMTWIVMDLPDKYKRVVLLYFYQGLTIRETAEALGMSTTTVHRRLQKAEDLLKNALERSEAHE
ncbi:MAG: sigma-70 family RNA polymerase sigma factor [Lachnospiraceae bacterium]|nr:sigma-70 family RNA polymerase sigma factor [Lachnospiraceae bacterium]